MTEEHETKSMIRKSCKENNRLAEIKLNNDYN